MRPIRYFVVDVPVAVKETVKVGDVEIFLDNRFNEFTHRAFEGEVVGVPARYDTGVEIGDTLYFHHHVVLGGNHMLYRDQQIQEVKGKRGQYIYADKDLYYVTYDGGRDPYVCQAYAHKSKKTGEVKLLGEWIFLTPAKQEDELKSDILEIVQKKKDYNQFGYIRYGSKQLEELGLREGDKVFFMKNADYEMEIDGERLYRVLLNQIYAKVRDEEEEV